MPHLLERSNIYRHVWRRYVESPRRRAHRRNSRFFNKVYVVCVEILRSLRRFIRPRFDIRNRVAWICAGRIGVAARFVSLSHFSPTTNCAQRRQSASDGARGVTLCRLKPDKTTRGEKKNGGTLTNRRKMPTRDVGGGSSADAVALFPLVHVDLRFFLPR